MAIPKVVVRLLVLAVAMLGYCYFGYTFYEEMKSAESRNAPDVERFFSGEGQQHASQGHTNNWAVLVCTSRFWFNYRHMANALGMYRTVKRLGIPDSQIILMLADDAACNPRNRFPGTVYANAGRHLDLYGTNIEVDYRGYEVTVENFIRVLTGRVADSVPRSKRLLTDDRSNVFMYLTGHGGNEFLKFQDNEELSAFDIADAIEQMWQKKRYNEIFLMVDTCQANTMYSKLYSPNVLATGSSKKGQNSYSYENDADIGVAVIDSFTHHALSYLENVNKTNQVTMADFFASYSLERIKSDAGVRADLFNRPLDKTLLTDFFGGVAQVEIVDALPSVQGEESHQQPNPGNPIMTPLEPIYPSSSNRTTSPSPLIALNKRKLQPDDKRWWKASQFRGWGAAALIGLLVAQTTLGSKSRNTRICGRS